MALGTSRTTALERIKLMWSNIFIHIRLQNLGHKEIGVTTEAKRMKISPTLDIIK